MHLKINGSQMTPRVQEFIAKNAQINIKYTSNKNKFNEIVQIIRE